MASDGLGQHHLHRYDVLLLESDQADRRTPEESHQPAAATAPALLEDQIDS